MIAFSAISKQYGRQVLFVDASFQLNPGEKVGLVGPNGSGKTTLFRMITGEEQPDEGEVSVPRKLSVGYFRQDVEEMSGRSVLDEAIAGSGRLGALHHELEHLQNAMSDPEKADDMVRQERSLKSDGRRVAIVSDSGADLPADIWDQFGIQMVPLRVNFGNESHLDKVGMTARVFWAELDRNPLHPKTSQPPPGDFRRAYELLSSHFEHVVAVSLTGTLSGTYQAALSAASRVSKPDQLTVVDSKNVSVGMGLVVLCAAENAQAGKPAAEVLAALERAVAHTRTYGALPDLSYAVRGGRIPQPWRWLARALPLGFLLGIDGRGGVKIRGILRRRSDRVSALVRLATQDRLLKSGSTPLRLAIAHANSPEAAEALRAACTAVFPNLESILVSDLGPAYGAHGGPGTLALAIQEYQAPA